MIRNSKVFTDDNGNSQEIEYTIIDRIDGTIIAKDWNIDDDAEVERTPTEDEIHALEEQEAGLTTIRNLQVPETAIIELQGHLDDPALNTVEDVKAVLKDFIDSIQ